MIGHINQIKWSATFLCLTGIALTSYNIYPYNIFFGLIGSSMWAWCGWEQKDMALFLVEAVAVLFYIMGFVHLL